jgi:hypothetical protein
MTKQHPITPPPEVADRLFMIEGSEEDRIIAAYRAGADQELEACCEWLDTGLMTPYVSIRLRSARRPKPPTLKEQALAVLVALEIDEPGYEGTYNTIRRALEALDD